jgi:hypothetical protein
MKPTGSAKRPPRARPYVLGMMAPLGPDPDSRETVDPLLLPTSVDAPDTGRLRRHRGLRMAAVLPLLAGAGLLLAACSGGSSASGSTTTSTTAAGAAGSFQAYLSCLRSHGASFPTGGGGGTPGSFNPGSSTGGTRPTIPASERSTFDKAESACASLRPKGGTFPGGGGQSTAFAAYRNCLKLHGVTLPSGGGGFFGGGGSSTTTSTTNPKLEAAEAACASLRPKGGFGRGPSGSTTTTS